MFHSTRAFPRSAQFPGERWLIEEAQRSKPSRHDAMSKGLERGPVSGTEVESNNRAPRSALWAWVFILALASLAMPRATHAHVLNHGTGAIPVPRRGAERDQPRELRQPVSRHQQQHLRLHHGDHGAEPVAPVAFRRPSLFLTAVGCI